MVKYRNIKAFTLVELLVVISIIALLLAMLMPALSMAREQGRSVVCRKNLSSIGFAFYLFREDNGKFPCQQIEYYNNYWTTLIKKYIDPTNPKLFCPSNKKPFVFWEYDKSLPESERIKLTYAFNSWGGLANKKNEMSSKLALLADGKAFHIWAYAHINPKQVNYCKLNFIHNDNVNILFFDNHVERVAKNKLHWQSFNPEPSSWLDRYNIW